MKKQNKGFTLIETLVTVTVLALLLGLAYQSVSIFMKATNNSKSRFHKIEQEVELKLNLRASIRSMLDYYVKPDPTKPKQLYLFNDDNVLRYVSLSSFFFDDRIEVTVQLETSKSNEGSELIITECPLSEFIPLSLEQTLVVTEKCRQRNYLLDYTSVSFGVELFEEDARESLSLRNAPGITFDSESQIEHLLPKFIKVHLQSDDSDVWAFRPVIENKSKYLDGHGQDINI